MMCSDPPTDDQLSFHLGVPTFVRVRKRVSAQEGVFVVLWHYVNVILFR